MLNCIKNQWIYPTKFFFDNNLSQTI